jgi:hypothetical protein
MAHNTFLDTIPPNEAMEIATKMVVDDYFEISFKFAIVALAMFEDIWWFEYQPAKKRHRVVRLRDVTSETPLEPLRWCFMYSHDGIDYEPNAGDGREESWSVEGATSPMMHVRDAVYRIKPSVDMTRYKEKGSMLLVTHRKDSRIYCSTEMRFGLRFAPAAAVLKLPYPKKVDFRYFDDIIDCKKKESSK